MFQKALIRRTCNCSASCMCLSAPEPVSQRDVSMSGKKGKEKPNSASGSDPLRRLAKRTKGVAFAIATSFRSKCANLLFGLVTQGRWYYFSSIQPDLFHCVPHSIVCGVL